VAARDPAGQSNRSSERPALASGVTESLIKLSHLLSRPFSRLAVEAQVISLAEWRVLVRIERTPGITAQEIARRTGISPMNVSRALSALRSDGRVAMDRDPADSRRNLLQLTAAGRSLFDELYPSAAARSLRLVESLSLAELRELDGMLRRIGDHVDRIDAAEDPLPHD